MPLPDALELSADLPPLPLLFEDRDCLVLDKPEGWDTRLLEDESAPPDNLQAVLRTAVVSEQPWARDNEIRFLRLVTHIDADATGPILVAKSLRAVHAFARQFEGRPPRLEHLAVIGGKPNRRRWVSCLKLRPDPTQVDRMLTHTKQGLHAETAFEVLSHGEGMALLLIRPKTHRPHQIRAQLAAQELPILGDRMYGLGRDLRRQERDANGTPIPRPSVASPGLALRAMRLVYTCPFTARPIEIVAPMEEFLERFGFSIDEDEGEAEELTDEDEGTGDEAPRGNEAG